MAGHGVVALVVLLLIDWSVADNGDEGINSLNTIKSELAQLSRTVNDLTRKDDEQAKRISQLENELGLYKKQNADLQWQQLESQKRIRDLEDSVDELKGMVEDEDKNEEDLNDDSGASNTLSHDNGRDGLNYTGGMESDQIERRNGIETGNPILADIHSLKRSGRLGSGRRQAEGISQVAFSATISPHDYGPLGTNQIVQFDHVLSNTGNAYHAHSGIFTAPVGGVYVISATISGLKPSADHIYLKMKKNGNFLCYIWAAGGHQSSQLLVLNLQANDEIYVSNNLATDLILGSSYSSFSGFLLYPSGESTIIGK